MGPSQKQNADINNWFQTKSTLAEHIMQCADEFKASDSPCFPSPSVDPLHFIFQGSAPDSAQEPLLPPDFVHELHRILKTAVKVHSPNFIGHMTGALPMYVPALMHLLGSAHQNVVKLETSGGLASLEKWVLRMFHQQCYQQDSCWYDEVLADNAQSLGGFCSGATVGNLTALWALRNHIQHQNPDMPLSSLRIFVSELGHYSIRKSVDILGLAGQVVSLPAKDMQGSCVLLQSALEALNGAPSIIIGIAGSTETGSIDHLQEMARLAKRYKSLFHVDAAFGGAFLCSTQKRLLFAGIEHADTLVIDAHKQLFVPMGCGLVLYQSPTMAKSIAFNAQYIIREGSGDLGQTTLEGSRPAMSLILYSHLRLIGIRGLGQIFDQLCQICVEFGRFIQAQPDFELTSDPILNILTYRYRPKNDEKDLNRLIIAIQEAQKVSGQGFVSRTALALQGNAGGLTDVFRVVLSNPQTSLEHCKTLLIQQRALGRQLM